jgi:hypothetical protein
MGIKMDLRYVAILCTGLNWLMKETGGVEGWIELAHERDRGVGGSSEKVISLRVRETEGKVWSAYTTGDFPKRAQPHGVSQLVSQLVT